MTAKICSKCNIEKDLSEFHNKSLSKDGKAHTCKICKKQYRIDHKEHMKQYRIDNKVYKAEYDKQYQIDNKIHISKRVKQYQIDNKIHISTRKKQYRIDNKEHLAEYSKRYSKNNPEKMRDKRRKTDARRRGWGTPQPINEYFADSHLHHLHINGDHQICIYIPVELHSSVWHSNTQPESMIAINLICLKWYYGLTIKGVS